jgi:carboxyl-terminal processing protease
MRWGALALLLILFSVNSYGQSGNRCERANVLIRLIQKNHVQPIPVEDEWSIRVFNNMFDQLDPKHLYFTQQDLDSFSKQRIQLDSLVTNNKHCAWIATVSDLFKKRVSDYKLWLEQALSKPFDYRQREQFDLENFPSRDFCTTSQALHAYRKSYLKFLMLMRMYVEQMADSSGGELTSYENFARKNIGKKELQKLSDIERKGFEAYTGELFLKAIALAYDPHTTYMSDSEYETFNQQLSDESLSFGFSLAENGTGSFEVSDIIPGGPAWNSNAVREGDILLSVLLVDNRDLHAMDYDLGDFKDAIASPSITKATFTFRHANGQFINVELVKEKIRSVENTVSGYVLKGVKKIGFIPLPSFYFDRGKASGGAAGDVAKAIIKLKKENIEGLILDLRFNGGGSIEEAIDLAGIFIDFGPVIMLKNPDQSIAVLKDMTRGTIYNGPLIVLVNGFSASASELLASSLQDHKRALIVGGRTHGKGTGQHVLPLAGSTTEFSKITSLKVYRINGKTFQHRGVIPDIVLPDVTQSLGDREEDYPNALPSDSVSKKTYYTPLAMKAFTPLAEKSMARIAQSPAFQGIQKFQQNFPKPIPLDIAGFYEYVKRPDTVWAENQQPLTVTNTAFDDSLLALDAFRQALSEKSVQEIRQSIYIQEAYNIMVDYILQK